MKQAYDNWQDQPDFFDSIDLEQTFASLINLRKSADQYDSFPVQQAVAPREDFTATWLRNLKSLLRLDSMYYSVHFFSELPLAGGVQDEKSILETRPPPPLGRRVDL